MGKFYTDRSVKKQAQASQSLSLNLKFEAMPPHSRVSSSYQLL